MTARQNYVFTNKYIPPPPSAGLKWYEQDLDTWYKETKYKKATDDPEHYFNHVKFINFDIIYNDICKSKLQKSIKDYKTINKEDFDNYEHRVKGNMISSAHGSERDNIFFAKDLDRTHFLEKYPAVELSAMKKGLRISKNKLLTLVYKSFAF